jgi:hypothetical protein
MGHWSWVIGSDKSPLLLLSEEFGAEHCGKSSQQKFKNLTPEGIYD